MASKNRLDQAAGASIGGFFSKSDESKPEPEQTARESRKPPYTDEQMDEALKTVYRTGKQIDGANYLNINKGTFNKKIREIEEKEPERVKRLKAEAEAEKDTPQTAEHKDEDEKITVTIIESEKQEQQTIPIKIVEAPKKPQEAPKQIQLIKSTPAEEKAEEKPLTKPQKQSFSFRADQNKIENWKLYAETIGTKDIGTLWTAAIDEYISNHALTADQQEIYDLKKKAAEMAKKQK